MQTNRICIQTEMDFVAVVAQLSWLRHLLKRYATWARGTIFFDMVIRGEHLCYFFVHLAAGTPFLI